MKKASVLLAFCALSLLSSGCASKSLPRASYPGSEAFGTVFNDVWSEGCNELHSLMVLKDGKVIFERYETGHGPNELHILWSASKTFTATAVGFACQDGKMTVEDKVVSWFKPEELPEEISPWLAQMTVHDLLIMSSGIGADLREKTRRRDYLDWAKETLCSTIHFEPGTLFEYNSMDTYLLAVIVTRAVGEQMSDYLNRKLFVPLGITDWIWEKSPQGYDTGGWGLFLSLESFAKMGQFMLQRGVWKGKRLLAEDWFDAAMSPQIMQYQGRGVSEEWVEAHSSDDWNQGYGYQMWCCTRGAYRLDGAWSQYCIIIPEKRAVVAALSHTPNGSRLLNSIWNNIYDNL